MTVKQFWNDLMPKEACEKHNQLLRDLVAASSEYIRQHGNSDGTDVYYTSLQDAVVNWNTHHLPPDYTEPNPESFK